MLDLVTVGDVLLDVLLPAEAAGRHAPIAVRAGGSAVNAALAATELGARAAVVGRVGDDPAGRAIADELDRLGIVSLLAVDDTLATGTAVYRGEVLVADRGANAAFESPELPPARATLVSGYLPAKAIAAALAGAHGLTALDTQGRDDGPFAASVLIGPSLALDDHADRHRVVCSTLGAAGAAAIRDGERATAMPPQVVEGPLPGAGDAFAAAFVLALADERPLVDCLDAACAAGAAVSRRTRAC